MKTSAHLFLISLFLTVLTQCSTTQHKALRQVAVGMDKAEVLEVAGNPARTGRSSGMDRWTYETIKKDGKEVFYVFFADGKVTYTGPSDAFNIPKGPSEKKTFKAIGE